jgi:glucose/arabinose dehydrogenase
MKRPLLVLAAVLLGAAVLAAPAQGEPTVLDRNLSVRTHATGLVTPTTMAFIGLNDVLVLEKNTGRVRRVVNGALQGTVLDLAVNFGSERGLLGIARTRASRSIRASTSTGRRARRGRTRTSSRPLRCSATGSTATSGTAAR